MIALSQLVPQLRIGYWYTYWGPLVCLFYIHNISIACRYLLLVSRCVVKFLMTLKDIQETKKSINKNITK